MSKGINKAIILGNLGVDPETRYTQGGSPITSFSVATSEGWKDKQSGEAKERTEWHNIVAFGKLAEICGEYLRKGSKVYVEGSLRTSSWESDGVKKYKTEIIADQMQMLDSKGSAPQESREPERKQPAPVTPPVTDDEFDDNIPF